MKCRAFLGYLWNYSLLTDTAPCSKLMYSDNDALIVTVSILRMAGNLKPRRGDILLLNKEICLNNTDMYNTDSITMASFYQLHTKDSVFRSQQLIN